MQSLTTLSIFNANLEHLEYEMNKEVNDNFLLRGFTSCWSSEYLGMTIRFGLTPIFYNIQLCYFDANYLLMYS